MKNLLSFDLQIFHSCANYQAVRAGFEPASISTNNTLIIKYIQDAKHCRSILVSEITFDPFIRTKVIIPDYMSCILLKVILIF